MPRRTFLDVPATAEYLATTERHIRRLVHERRIPFHKVGGLIRFDEADLDAWLAKHRVEAAS